MELRPVFWKKRSFKKQYRLKVNVRFLQSFLFPEKEFYRKLFMKTLIITVIFFYTLQLNAQSTTNLLS